MRKPKNDLGLWVKTSKSYDFLLASPVVKLWINSYTSSKTRDDYLRCLELVVTESTKSPEELLALSPSAARREVVSISQRLVKEQKYSYARQILTAMRGFFEANDKVLKLHRADRVKKIRKKIRYEHIPSREEIYRMVDASSRLRDKSILLCLFQSGVRVGCLIRWKIGLIQNSLFPDIEVPIPLKITNDLDTKLSGYGLGYYYTFLGKEAAHALKSYLDQRLSKERQLRDDDYIFKGLTTRATRGRLHDKDVLVIVKSAAKSIGLNPKTVWTHLIRKSFRKVLNQSDLDEDTKEALMGHRLPGSRMNYFDYHDLNEISSKYLTCNFDRKTISSEIDEFEVLIKALAKARGIDPNIVTIVPKGISFMRSSGPAIDIWREDTGGLHIETIELPQNDKSKIRGFVEALATLVGGRTQFGDEVILPPHMLRYETVQIIVDEKDLSNHLSHGYRFVSSLPSGKILIEKVI